MNHTILIGWITFPVELNGMANGSVYIHNYLSVARKFKDEHGKSVYDTFPFTIFGDSAELFYRMIRQHDKVTLSGHLQSSTNVTKEAYMEDGIIKARDKIIYETVLIVDEFDVASFETEKFEFDDEKYEKINVNPEDYPDLFIG